MIHVHKDYNDIPRSLLSPKVKKAVSNILNIKTSLLLYQYIKSDVRDKLNEIYHGKCAYCESVLKVKAIEQYRPQSMYYWTALEWSNLLLVCTTCNREKIGDFPILGTQIIEPQSDRNEWRADSVSFLAEEPLLLNPEIDYPHEHLSFYPDGRMYGLTERGNVTIEILKLNREDLVVKRMQIIEEITETIKKIIVIMSNFTSISIEDEPTHNLLRVLVEPIYEHTQPESEFSFFYQCLLANFDKFVGKRFDTIASKEIIKSIQDFFIGYVFDKRESEKLLTLQKSFTIESIHIKNIKCFEDTIIQFDNKSTVLLGVNGRGKTTILQLLALGLTGCERPFFESEWENVLKNNTLDASFDITLKQGEKQIILSYSISEDDRVKTKNSESYKSIYKDLFFIAYGTGRNAEPHNFKLNEDFKNIASLFGVNQRTEFADYLKQGNAFLQIKRIITLIFNQADDIYNRIELSRFDENLKTFLFNTPTNPDIEIPLSALSAGFRTSFQWILDFVVQAWKRNFDLDKPETIYGIVIIDELDTHLHIKWQRTIINTLQAVFKNVQFIVSTHSPFIVQAFGNQNIVSLQLTKENVIANQIHIEQGSSYESIIKELFGEKAIFSVEIEHQFEVFYAYLKEIRRGNKSINEVEFKQITNELNQKGEEVSTIVSLELRQLKFESNKKK